MLKFLTVNQRVTWRNKDRHGGCIWGVVLFCTMYSMLFLFVSYSTI